MLSLIAYEVTAAKRVHPDAARLSRLPSILGTVALGKGDTTGITANQPKSNVQRAYSLRPSLPSAVLGSSDTVLGIRFMMDPITPRINRATQFWSLVFRDQIPRQNNAVVK
mmetsp:Transcript_22562/g.33571  ORF Transcript_22562/g.33571 Transcript_22562/m.33571 type:complete len:111 (-) Transcript_22562:707-1039(-)